MISGAFAVALLLMRVRTRCPITQVPLPEIHNKVTEINGLTLQQPFFEHVGLCRPSIADRMWDDQQLSHCDSLHVSLFNLSCSGAIALS